MSTRLQGNGQGTGKLASARGPAARSAQCTHAWRLVHIAMNMGAGVRGHRGDNFDAACRPNNMHYTPPP